MGLCQSLYFVTDQSIKDSGSVGTMWNFTLIQSKRSGKGIVPFGV